VNGHFTERCTVWGNGSNCFKMLTSEDPF